MSSHRLPGLWSKVRRVFRKPQTPQCAPTMAFPIASDWSDSYDSDLLRFLQQELARVGRIRASHWVMSPEWFDDVCVIRSPTGRPYLDSYTYGCVELLGIPVRVHSFAGVPTLMPLKF